MALTYFPSIKIDFDHLSLASDTLRQNKQANKQRSKQTKNIKKRHYYLEKHVTVAWGEPREYITMYCANILDLFSYFFITLFVFIFVLRQYQIYFLNL